MGGAKTRLRKAYVAANLAARLDAGPRPRHSVTAAGLGAPSYTIQMTVIRAGFEPDGGGGFALPFDLSLRCFCMSSEDRGW